MYRSAHDALSFAYRTIGKPIVKVSSVGRMQADMMRGARGGDDMSEHDRHAQAAMIIGLVERSVDAAGKAYFAAYYAKALKINDREEDPVLIEAARSTMNALVRAVITALPTGIHGNRGVQKLILIYFGRDISMTSVRVDFGCRHATSNEYRTMVHDAIDKIGQRAEDAAYRALDAAGLINQEMMA